MSLRIGGHAGPVHASIPVRGGGFMLWLLLSIVIGSAIVYWPVTVTVLGTILATWLIVKVRDRRRLA